MIMGLKICKKTYARDPFVLKQSVKFCPNTHCSNKFESAFKSDLLMQLQILNRNRLILNYRIDFHFVQNCL